MYRFTTFEAVDKIMFLRKAIKDPIAKSKTVFAFNLPLNTLHFAQSSSKSPLPVRTALIESYPTKSRCQTNDLGHIRLSNNKWVGSYMNTYSCFH